MLTAAPAQGSSLSSWSTCGGTSATCTVMMTSDVNETVVFVPNYALTVTTAGDGTGTVTGAPGAINCTTGSSAGCSAAYPSTPLQVVTLTASPATGSLFTGWSGSGCSGTSQTCAVNMDQARTITATFVKLYTVAATTSGSGGVTASPAALASSACGPSCTQYTYRSGDIVSLTAAAGAGSYFASWTGDCAGQGATCKLTMSASYAATASFGAFNTLAITKAGTGTVTSRDGAIRCGATCSAQYRATDVVTLDAVADPGAVFAGWSNACTTSPCVVAMDVGRTVTASFDYDLQLGTTGNGTVGATAAPLSCTPAGGFASCGAYPPGTSVTITATPAAASSFLSWSGACAGQTTPTCSVTMTAAATATANFVANYTLTVTTAGDGGGTVTGTPGNLACSTGSSTGCSADYPSQPPQTVTLTATASNGSLFTGWSGACAGNTPSCSVVMSQARGVAAKFQKLVKLTASAVGPGSLVATQTSGFQSTGSCGNGCALYTAGSTVTLAETPANNAYFIGWSGACSGTAASCALTLTADTTTAASFSADNQLTVTINGDGRVTANDSSISCPSTCSAVYPGTTVTLTAAASAGSTFAAWGGACAGSLGNTCTLTMDQTRGASATFYYNLDMQLGAGGATVAATTSGGVPCAPAAGYTTCTAYAAGTAVTVAQTPGTDYDFAGWGGACSGGAACQVTMTSAQRVTTSYAPKAYGVSVTVNAISAGTTNAVTSSPPGINCGGTCTGSFTWNTAVTLTAGLDPYGKFDGWSGGPCAGSASTTCTFNVPSGGASTTASFSQFGTMTILSNDGDPANGYTGFRTTASSSSTAPAISCVTPAMTGACVVPIARGAPITIFYQPIRCGSVAAPATLVFTGKGDCTPDSTTKRCSITPTVPGNYTSGADVACEPIN